MGNLSPYKRRDGKSVSLQEKGWEICLPTREGMEKPSPYNKRDGTTSAFKGIDGNSISLLKKKTRITGHDEELWLPE
jgi:hypothetical protein